MRRTFIVLILFLFLITATTATAADIPLSYHYWMAPIAPINPKLVAQGDVSLASMNGYDAVYNNPTYLPMDNWNITPLSTHVWGEDIRKIVSIIQGNLDISDAVTDFSLFGIGSMRGGASLGIGFAGKGFGFAARAMADIAMNRQQSLYYINIEYSMGLGYAHRFKFGNRSSLTVGATLRPFMRTTSAGQAKKDLSDYSKKSLVFQTLRNNGFDDIADILERQDISLDDIEDLSIEEIYTDGSIDPYFAQAIGKLETSRVRELLDVMKEAGGSVDDLQVAAVMFNYIDSIMVESARGWGIAADFALRFDIRSISITAQFRDFYLPGMLTHSSANSVSDLVKTYLNTGFPLDITSNINSIFVRYIPEIRLGVAWNPYLGRRTERFFDVSVYTEFVDPFGLLQKEKLDALQTFLYSMRFGTEILLFQHLALRAGITQGYLSTGVGVDFVIGQLNAALYGVDIGMPLTDTISINKQAMGVAVDLHFSFDVKY